MQEKTITAPSTMKRHYTILEITNIVLFNYRLSDYFGGKQNGIMINSAAIDLKYEG